MATFHEIGIFTEREMRFCLKNTPVFVTKAG